MRRARAVMMILALWGALPLLSGCDSQTAPQILDGGIGGVVDPVSMPAAPTMSLADAPAAASCQPCHPTQYAEWRGSRHGDAMTDRVFQGLVAVRQQARAGREDRFCVQCHGVLGSRTGAVRPGFRFADLPAPVMDGVACTICHRAAEVVRPYNAGLRLASDPGGAVLGGLDAPQGATAHPTQTASHLGTSRFCAGCHDVRELIGLSLERPFEEWEASPSFAAGQTCQDCHMPRYDGAAALGGPARTGLRSHRFVGFDPPGAINAQDPALRAAFAADLQALLGSAAGLEVRVGAASAGQTLDVVVSAQNRIAGHSLPTGTTFIRQCWLEVIATDDSGKILYQTGTLDASGDLRDRWSGVDPYGDADLVSLSSQLLGPGGTPTLFPWEAVEHHRNALRAGETRTFTYFVPVPAGATGAIHVAARLRMRPAPPFLLRLLKLDDLLPFDEPRDLASAAAAATVQ